MTKPKYTNQNSIRKTYKGINLGVNISTTRLDFGPNLFTSVDERGLIDSSIIGFNLKIIL